MNQQREAYIGLDVHKDSITIGMTEMCGAMVLSKAI